MWWKSNSFRKKIIIVEYSSEHGFNAVKFPYAYGVTINIYFSHKNLLYVTTKKIHVLKYETSTEKNG